MELPADQIALLNRFGVATSAIEKFNPAANKPVTVEGSTIVIDGPIVSSLEEKLLKAFGLDIGLVSPAAFRDALKEAPAGDLDIAINSPGGSVFDASVIQSLILDRRKNDTVSATVQGIAASAASFITFAGDPIRMAPMSMLMVHQAHALVQGNAKGLREFANILDKVDTNIIEQLVEASNLDEKDARSAVEAETWWTASEALELGIASEVISLSDPAGSGPSASSRLGALASGLAFEL